MSNTSNHHPRITALPTVVVFALSLTAGSILAGTASASTTAATSPAPKGQVVTPGAVGSIVAADSAINNQANASLSVALQNSHETCLEQLLDDATYRGTQAEGSNNLGVSFDQVPTRTLVPSETSYPAFFSVLAKDQASGQPVTNNLLTYVKTSTSARWKLSLSSQILGPTAAGVTVPAATTNSAGYVTALDPASSDGLALAPDKVAARVAAAFTTEAASGKLPSGVSAEFGPNKEADPHAIAATFARLGSATTTFSATTPAAAAGTSSAACPRPAIRLANGGALVTFAVFVSVAVHVKNGDVVVQPPDRSAFGALLSPGIYSSVTILQGDMGVAIVPPAGSHASIDVIGQAIEGLTETGVSGSGSSGSGAVIGPANAAAIAKGIDSKVVDVETTLGADERAFGTGMVLKSNGEVLTNNHVVEGATSINVTDVGNGKTYKATVVGYDRSADVAVLQLQNASGLATVSIGDSATVHKGALVVGVGNAGGTGGTPSYTGGSVIALGQSITASDQGDGTSEQLTGLMETDADIQPGDSGGPLVNTSGKVIGMDTAASGGFSFEPGSSSSSQAFSIPINTAVNVAGQITSGKSSSVVHIGPTAFLGVALAALAAPGQDRIGQPAPSSGAQIATVVSGSPAAKAGLEEGDTITSFAGHPVTTPNSLTTVISGLKPGASVSLVYLDLSDNKHTVTAHLASGPPQ